MENLDDLNSHFTFICNSSLVTRFRIHESRIYVAHSVCEYRYILNTVYEYAVYCLRYTVYFINLHTVFQNRCRILYIYIYSIYIYLYSIYIYIYICVYACIFMYISRRKSYTLSILFYYSCIILRA